MLKNRYSIYIVLVLLLAVIGGSVLAAPGEFDLIEPGNIVQPGPTLINPKGNMSFVWEKPVDAVSYELMIDRITDTTVNVYKMTLNDTEDLTCGLTCIYNVPTIDATLKDEGLYSWNVIAYDLALKTVSSPQSHTGANAYHYFTVKFAPAPAPFNLLSPEDGTVIADVNAEIVVTWEASDAAAVSYNWILTRPVEAEVIIPVETTACVEGTCTLTIPAETAASTLTENGLYHWTVMAVSEVPEEIEATNGPFEFTVADPSLQELVGFSLVAPANNAFIRSLPADGEIVWTHDPEATSYDFYLYKLSNNTSRFGEVLALTDLTPEADDDSLACAEGACVLSADFSVVFGEDSKGTYSWTVVAANIFSEFEANNAPYLFEINTEPIQLVKNGGFEVLNSDKKPVDWTSRNFVLGNKVLCNKLDKTFTPYGECAIQFKAGAKAKLQQRLDASLMLDGDLVTFSTAVDPRNAPVGKKLGQLKIFLSDDTVEVLDIVVPGEVLLRGVDDYVVVEASTTLDLGERTITRAVVIFKNRLNTGRLLFDEVSVMIEQTVAPPPANDGLIPLPAPADS